MIHLGVRRPQNAPTGLSDFHAQVDVVEGYREVGLIQSPNRLEHAPPQCQTGTGHRRDLTDQS